MAKIVLSLDGRIIAQAFLDTQRITIGRDPACTLVVPVAEVSSRHAEIYGVINDHFIEDLGSTNGTVVNGKAVNRHLLQNGDVVFLGEYRLKYLNTAHARLGFDRTQILDPAQISEFVEEETQAPIILDCAGAAAHAARERLARGRVHGLAGRLEGQDILIERVLLPIGNRGECSAVINRRPGGCFLTHVDGRVQTLLNGAALGSEAVPLADGDIIDAGAERLRFHTVANGDAPSVVVRS
ncbi:FHA domain-containing protein [Azoarcus sp. L1K30]|uniref:FHA domain-containing protein n=1 Tax=Azoarcus sp. L1K30 TaxID=2820277 RepID=UPI001B828B23|nr:FHA domain-containing protein [Azoarcus sp. L1K30]MBR0565117.1 FHA domain-containing protein [Azoarcus sp. L1K30]